MKIIETERLYLRTIQTEDAQNLFAEIFSNKNVVQHTFGKKITNIDQAKVFMAEHCNTKGSFGLSALINKETDALIGLAGPIECRYLNELDYEFGFILGEDHWGKGYAKEIGQAQIDFIRHNTDAKRILANVTQANHGSLKTLKNLGLEYLTSIKTETRGDKDIYVLNFK